MFKLRNTNVDDRNNGGDGDDNGAADRGVSYGRKPIITIESSSSSESGGDGRDNGDDRRETDRVVPTRTARQVYSPSPLSSPSGSLKKKPLTTVTITKRKKKKPLSASKLHPKRKVLKSSTQQWEQHSSLSPSLTRQSQTGSTKRRRNLDRYRRRHDAEHEELRKRVENRKPPKLTLHPEKDDDNMLIDPIPTSSKQTPMRNTTASMSTLVRNTMEESPTESSSQFALPQHPHRQQQLTANNKNDLGLSPPPSINAASSAIVTHSKAKRAMLKSTTTTTTPRRRPRRLLPALAGSTPNSAKPETESTPETAPSSASSVAAGVAHHRPCKQTEDDDDSVQIIPPPSKRQPTTTQMTTPASTAKATGTVKPSKMPSTDQCSSPPHRQHQSYLAADNNSMKLSSSSSVDAPSSATETATSSKGKRPTLNPTTPSPNHPRRRQRPVVAAVGNSKESSPYFSKSETSTPERDMLLPPRLSFFKSHCWCCRRSLYPHEEQSLYTLHLHPFLNAAVCCLCAEQLAELSFAHSNNVDEDDVDKEHNVQEELETCYGCLFQNNCNNDAIEEQDCEDDDDDVDSTAAAAELLLCDDCPKGFCARCVRRVLVGTERRTRVQFQAIQQAPTWSCLACQPPASLKTLQQEIHDGNKNGNDNDGTTTPDDKEIVQLVHRLIRVEDELRECERQDTQSHRTQQHRHIQEELRNNHFRDDDTNAIVQEEELLLEKSWLDHELLLQDTVTDLLTKLQIRGGISADRFYRYYREHHLCSDGAVFQNTKEDYLKWNQWINKEEEETRRTTAARGKILSLDDSGDDSDVDSEEEAYMHVEDLENMDYCLEEWESEDFRSSWKHETRLSVRELNRKHRKLLERDDRLIEKYNNNGTASNRKIWKIRAHQDLQRHERAVVVRGPRREWQTHVESILLEQKEDEMAKKKRRRSRKKRESCAFVQKRSLSPQKNSISPSAKRMAAMVEESDVVGPVSREEDDEKAPCVPRRIAPTLITSPQDDESDDAMDCSAKTLTTMDAIGGGSGSDGEDFDFDLIRLSQEGDSFHKICIERSIALKLKPHQIEGVKFIWRNTFRDLDTAKSMTDVRQQRGVGGCIIAHNMGLGKSCQVIAVLATVMLAPNLRLPDESRNPIRHINPVRHVVLVVPTNTLTNWVDEFYKWVGAYSYNNRMLLTNINEVAHYARSRKIREWQSKGGVFLVTESTFARQAADTFQCLKDKADLFILDEAHVMLKNTGTRIYKALSGVSTLRRIVLSGTPVQNNLREYYHMASWVRPNSLGTKAEFERKYVQPINAGMASDSTEEQVAEQVKASKELYSIMSVFMDRKDSKILAQELPPLQQTILFLRQSQLQAKLNRSFKKFHKSKTARGAKLGLMTFLHISRPLNNHPYCLMLQSQKRAERRASSLPIPEPAESVPLSGEQAKVPKVNTAASESTDGAGSDTAKKALLVGHVSKPIYPVVNSDDDAEGAAGKTKSAPTEINVAKERTNVGQNAPAFEAGKQGHETNDWMDRVLEDLDEKIIKQPKNGPKVFLLLQILAQSLAMNDKVVVFSQCLRTLDYLEEVLQMPAWGHICHGHENNPALGSWRLNEDFLRIDGSTNATDRGERISFFHNKLENAKAFLISIEAGGMGINLTGANRVVIFDSHWNPTVTAQAMHRVYRYGQTKPTYSYRFITEGTIEEKIFARASNKSGLAARVIDQKYPERNFSAHELADLQGIDNWVQCDRCERWRMLVCGEDEEELPEKWYCHMNKDPLNRKCEDVEKDNKWYELNTARIRELHLTEVSGTCQGSSTTARQSIDTGIDTVSIGAKKMLLQKDKVLMNIGLMEVLDLKSDGDKMSPCKMRSKGPAKFVSRIEFQEMLQADSKDLEIEASRPDILAPSDNVCPVAESMTAAPKAHAPKPAPESNPKTKTTAMVLPSCVSDSSAGTVPSRIKAASTPPKPTVAGTKEQGDEAEETEKPSSAKIKPQIVSGVPVAAEAKGKLSDEGSSSSGSDLKVGPNGVIDLVDSDEE